MSIRHRVAGTLAGLALAAALAPTAGADTITESYPETPITNPDLPIIHTTHGSDHIKANILNARPVCNPWEDHRTVVYKVTDTFMPVGTISTTNQTDRDIPLTQDLSKSQSIDVSINGDRTNSTTLNASHTHEGTSVGIAHTIGSSLAGSASYSLSWSAGQTIGPYNVPPKHTGEATYGFRVLDMTGTQQYCKPNGTWSTPTFWSALQPIKNEVRVKLYDNIADSFDPNKDYQGTEPVVEEAELNPVEDKEILNESEQPVTEEVATPEEGAAEENTDKTEEQHKLDLQPYLTTSGAKADGFAGTVALRVKNVGTDRYYGEFPATQFRVDVKTAKGPQGVDRLITPRSSNGAHIRDLGFNAETSTRSFEVTLANPINAGDEARVANLDFGDGLTSEGRLHNYIEVTQVSRINGDTSDWNDQNVDSRNAATISDTGKTLAGTF